MILLFQKKNKKRFLKNLIKLMLMLRRLMKKYQSNQKKNKKRFLKNLIKLMLMLRRLMKKYQSNQKKNKNILIISLTMIELEKVRKEKRKNLIVMYLIGLERKLLKHCLEKKNIK